MLNIFPKKRRHFFSEQEQAEIIAAIRQAEMQTSGEVRLYIESRCRYVDAIHRAKEIFGKLEMYKTRQRNAVLIYLALQDKQLAIYADEGIYKYAGENYWKQHVNAMIVHFGGNNYVQGIVEIIAKIGKTLAQAFPYNAQTDVNELPDDIVYGK